MVVVEISSPGGPEVLRPVERPPPEPAVGEVLIAVEAAGLNRGDLMQRQGYYPPPPGASDIPGLEVAGRVVALGTGAHGWKVGDRVCAILAGGGYAEYAVAPTAQCLPIPRGLSMTEAGALPETLFTCWTNLVDDGCLAAGETLLIHGGASGIGTTGIQMAKALGATVFVTAGSAAKCAACRQLGADLAIDYKSQDFVTVIDQATAGRGVDVVLDFVGGDYVRRSMQSMAIGGRHISIGIMTSPDATVSMPQIIMKRLRLTGSTLRGRSPTQKGAIAEALRQRFWPMIEQGKLRPVIHRSFPLAQAADAHRALEAGDHVGKIVLTTNLLEATMRYQESRS